MSPARATSVEKLRTDVVWALTQRSADTDAAVEECFVLVEMYGSIRELPIRRPPRSFAGFVVSVYMESGWNPNMDMHGVVNDWMQQERPLR